MLHLSPRSSSPGRVHHPAEPRMKMNFWQIIGIVVIVACIVAYFVRNHH